MANVSHMAIDEVRRDPRISAQDVLYLLVYFFSSSVWEPATPIDLIFQPELANHLVFVSIISSREEAIDGRRTLQAFPFDQRGFDDQMSICLFLIKILPLTSECKRGKRHLHRRWCFLCKGPKWVDYCRGVCQRIFG